MAVSFGTGAPPLIVWLTQALPPPMRAAVSVEKTRGSVSQRKPANVPRRPLATASPPRRHQPPADAVPAIEHAPARTQVGSRAGAIAGHY